MTINRFLACFDLSRSVLYFSFAAAAKEQNTLYTCFEVPTSYQTTSDVQCPLDTKCPAIDSVLLPILLLVFPRTVKDGLAAGATLTRIFPAETVLLFHGVLVNCKKKEIT